MTTTDARVTARWKAVGSGPAAAATRRFVCAECRHAQLFAVQPRALCTCESSELAGNVLFAGQPACSSLTPREGAGPDMGWCPPAAERVSECLPSDSVR
jgi:hypothetical protein